jgi:glycerol-3-phosphate acyltransferase PlsX
VALDAHGADGGPELVLAGARLAAAEGVPVRLFGPAGLPWGDGVELIATEEWISNDEDPLPAVRSKKEASIVRAAGDVAAGRSAALVSAGSTGAAMTAALFALKRLRGVQRPALAVQIPRPGVDGPPLLLLDVGANVEVRTQHLVQFAFLGAAFSAAVLGVQSPRVALLSVGEEQRKGREDVVEAHRRLSVADGIAFTGNVEGRDLLADVADVVVTDGFTGNVTLKTLEGTARAVADAMRGVARMNPISALGGLMLRPALGGLRQRMDPNSVGGAILLGLRGVAVVAHGSSTPEGIANAIRLANRTASEHAVDRTAALLRASGASRADLRDDAG